MGRLRIGLGLVPIAALVAACADDARPRSEYALPAPSAADARIEPDALFSGRVSPENAARRLVGGPDAIGGVGDFALGNGVLCAVVSDPAHEAILSPGGGVLVDLGHCGRSDDQWSVLQLHMLNLSRANIVPVGSVRADVSDGAARLVTTGSLDGIEVETTYELDTRLPDALRVTSRLARRGDGKRLFLLGDTALHGRRSLAPFVLSTRAAEPALGFDHPAVDTDRVLSIVAAIHPADLHVLVGSEDDGPGISYGLWIEGASLVGADGEARALSHFALNGEHFTLSGVFARPLWLGVESGIGWRHFAQTPFMSLGPGESLEIRRVLIVGARADAASVTDRLLSGAPRVRGSVRDARATVHVARERERGAPQPFTLARPDAGGAFEFRAPPGRYALRVLAPGAPPLETPFAVGAEDLDLGALETSSPATLLLPERLTARLVFLGLDGTPDPRFGDDGLEFRAGGRRFANSTASREVILAGTQLDPDAVTLAPGRYRVLATRGPEHEVTEARIALAPGETRSLEIAQPARAFETPGWIAADLHVHSGGSFDSTLPAASQVRAFAAQGGEVLVATEHDFVGDPRPTIRALGLEDRIAGVVGSEVTGSAESPAAPYTLGHANVFPLPPQPLAHRQGALRSEGRRLRELVRDARAVSPHTLLQLNHPRGLRDGDDPLDAEAFLTHLSVAGEAFRPELPLAAEPNRALLERDPGSGLRDLDFDLIELMSGSSPVHYRRTRADWLSLLLQGERRTGTANSDSHTAATPVALPRTWVRLRDDRVPAFDERAFLDALRGGHAVGSSGPWLDVALEGAGPGDTWRGRAGTLRVSVRTAAWVGADVLRVRVNGELAHLAEIAAGSAYAVPLRLERDAFVTVEVEGEPGELYAALAPGGRPLAFSNPIFVDADADGAWRAPGLPSSLPEILTDPEGTP
jgi:hypothetical protein